MLQSENKYDVIFNSFLLIKSFSCACPKLNKNDEVSEGNRNHTSQETSINVKQASGTQRSCTLYFSDQVGNTKQPLIIIDIFIKFKAKVLQIANQYL